MDLEPQIELILNRLDKIERDLLEFKNNNKIDETAFEKMQIQINLVSPMVMNKSRDKSGLE